MEVKSINFEFLKKRTPLLRQYAALAERYVFEDPNTALLKLRQFAELLAKEIAACTGAYSDEQTFDDILRALKFSGTLPPEVTELFYGIKKCGNRASHGHNEEPISQSEALYQLRMARTIAVWFYRVVGKSPNFSPGAFVPPPNPKDATAELTQELERLRGIVVDKEAEAEHAYRTANEQARLRSEAEKKASQAYGDLEAALSLAQETEEKLKAAQSDFQEQLRELQSSAQSASQETIDQFVKEAVSASQKLDLDEKDTRRLIDQQLRDAGWEADTELLRHASGALPQKGRNQAIAEWPTSNGPADYVLFVGLTPIAVVEAKRQNTKVADVVYQAGKYSKGFTASGLEVLHGKGWGEYQIPFLFSSNGRPYLKQHAQLSGIWFHDARRNTNHPRALEDWYTPDGLQALLSQDLEAAENDLQVEARDYLPLRDYQLEAIAQTEQALSNGQQNMLLAMATGTGKTRVAVCMVYRFLKAKRFRRILFLVDRTPLGEQMADKMKELKLENFQTLPEIYDVKEIGEIKVEKDTRLHIATIQGVIKRLFYNDNGSIPVDQYDCIIVDECHRGYMLDREMSELELSFRSEQDYISKYSRALDHFDAVKIGLTATPALHTTEIFGAPIYNYSYRQAVIDGWLVDHEPPVRIVTRLGKDGITWERGEEIHVVNTKSAQIELFKTPDEVHVEIEKFNRDVITENFNRTVLEYLATQIDPQLPGKTLIFCVNDLHADLVVSLFKEALEKQYGEIDDNAVKKITGAAKPSPRTLIKLYQNERYPNIAVTVDLLTTGIDVEEITNIVFLRRVKSRILFEQMLGRGTRLCPGLFGSGEDGDKHCFRVFDAVDIYRDLEDVSTMHPVVVNPKMSFCQLIDELEKAKDEETRAFVKEQIVAKLQRKKRSLKKGLREKFMLHAGESPEDATDRIKDLSPAEVLTWFKDHGQVITILDLVETSEGCRAFISYHEDGLISADTSFGIAEKPEDYLESFKRYLDTNRNQIPALLLVMQRPRELSRAQLKELKITLDQAGFGEVTIQTAWRSKTNQDIAASIIGYIRSLALGAPLVPYKERVEKAVKKILSSRAWTGPQRQWLQRIGKQLQLETVVDRESLNSGQFKTEGGFNRINKTFDGRLESILGDITEAIWTEAA